MVKTLSTMALPLGTEAPDFRLPDPDGKLYCLEDFKESPALVVAFICNHCPFVKHIREGWAQLVKEYQPKGVAVVGINSNDFENHPDDRPEKMAEEVKAFDYTFPYLIDESQEVAMSYHAACTPDFYVFDKNRELVYCGQMDGARPGNDVPVTGDDLRAALNTALEGRPISADQKPSLGCNIKWKAGNEPTYFKP